MVAALERQNLPVRAGETFCGLTVRCSRYRLVLPRPRCLISNSSACFKFFEIRADTALGGAHVLCERDLAREARVVVPGVFEKHRVSELGADGDVIFGEDKIRNLGEAVTRREIGTDDFDVAFFEDVADAVAPTGIPYTSHYTWRATRYPLLIPCLRRAWWITRTQIECARRSELVAAGRDRSRPTDRRVLWVAKDPIVKFILVDLGDNV